MPSCSNSSNIQSSFNALSVVQGSSRLLADITRVSGLTIGNVIRYDVLTSGFTASKADDAPNSEVFGVIESYDSTTDKFSVVLYGSINLTSSALVAISGSTGGSGGNDIYFLSGTTAGILQNLAPTSLNHIIKPVYQAAPHGSFSGMVMNYLGYKIGGDVEAISENNELGNIQIVVGDNDFSQGYIDASTSVELPISGYGEFYTKFGTQYGYVEKITTTNSIPGGVAVNNKVRQPNSNYIGTIIRIEAGNKILYISKSPLSALSSTSKDLLIDTGTSIATIAAPQSSAEIYSVYSPIITLSNPLIITGNSGTETTTQKQTIAIKVKPTGVTVNVPRSVIVTGLTASNIALGVTWSDVGTTLTQFESRIKALENRVNI